jgi:peptidoglycan-N-acetylglucosamine deacetylase
MFLHKTNFLMRALYPDFIWRKSLLEKKIYLTFDDGPIPEITEFVLETLAKYQAKATFFCIGDNIRKHPLIFQKLINEGHAIGNHTFNHLKGWATDDVTYLENVVLCSKEIEKENHQTQLFRPPYGRIKRSQAKSLLLDYEIVMWDVLSGDFSQKLSPETVLHKTIEHTKAGSILLFHDSIKAYKNMSYSLPRFLEYFSEKGFQFAKL